jgi:parvulin-like peptidyl-prolyl isomerase
MYRLLLINLLLINILVAEVVATVNGKEITQKDVDKFVSKSIPGAQYAYMDTIQKQKVLDQLIERELYIVVAKREGVTKDKQFEIELEKLKENLILDLWMKNKLEEIVVSEKEINQYYQEHDSKFHRSASASARHILVSTEAEAREIIQELEYATNLKEKFIELAKSRSTGPSSKNGGDLGWFSKDQMVFEFSNAAFALQKGQVTHMPVKTHFGYHVIYLTDKKPAGKVDFFKVRDSISQGLKLKKFQKKMKNLAQTLRKTANISVK